MRLGRVDGLDIEEYHRGEGISRSALKLFEDGTGRDVRHYLDHGVKATDAMKLGNAIDALVFEPERAAELIVVRPTFSRKKADLEARAEWEDAHLDRLVLTETQMDEATCVSQAVLNAPSVKALLRDIEPQPSYFYDVDGTLVKTRPDAVANGFAFDLKSTRSMSERHIWNAMVDLAYGEQQAMFREGMLSAGEEWKAGVIVWASKSAPWDVRLQLIESGDAILELGAMRVDRWIRDYAECVRANRWPDHSALIQKMNAPKWVARKLEDEIEREDNRLRAERNKENAA